MAGHDWCGLVMDMLEAQGCDRVYSNAFKFKQMHSNITGGKLVHDSSYISTQGVAIIFCPALRSGGWIAL